MPHIKVRLVVSKHGDFESAKQQTTGGEEKNLVPSSHVMLAYTTTCTYAAPSRLTRNFGWKH